MEEAKRQEEAELAALGDLLTQIQNESKENVRQMEAEIALFRDWRAAISSNVTAPGPSNVMAPNSLNATAPSPSNAMPPTQSQGASSSSPSFVSPLDDLGRDMKWVLNDEKEVHNDEKEARTLPPDEGTIPTMPFKTLSEADR